MTRSLFDQPEDGSLEDVLAAVGDPSRLRRVGYQAQRPYLCGIAAAVERVLARQEEGK